MNKSHDFFVLVRFLTFWSNILVTTMPASSHPIELDTTKLKQFHSAHFSGQSVPNISSASVQSYLKQANQVAHEDTKEYEEYEDNLGYYEDGVKRTLTAEQIEIFRNSEIRRLLAATRHEAEAREDHGSQGGDKELRPGMISSAQQKLPRRGEKNKAAANGVNCRSKKREHFDEPQNENTDVMLKY